jgi:hypothetical protein
VLAAVACVVSGSLHSEFVRKPALQCKWHDDLRIYQRQIDQPSGVHPSFLIAYDCTNHKAKAQ